MKLEVHTMDARSHKAGEMSPELKRAAELLVGRVLQDEEVVSLRVHQSGGGSAAEKKEAASKRLEKLFAEVDARRPAGLTEKELEKSIDEACAEVRYGSRG